MPKGRGITAARAFQAKDFVAVYGGELLSKDAAKQQKAEYLETIPAPICSSSSGRTRTSGES